MMKLCFQDKFVEVGLDEAGRGCIAGPVFAACVILSDKIKIEGLKDSKKLTPKQRYLLREQIENYAEDYAVAYCTNNEIDEWNILRATMIAMHRCLDKLKKEPEYIVVDGNCFYSYKGLPYKTIIKGDSTYCNIAAASILAKTYRDDYMNKIHLQYPMYGWDKNKGYATSFHLEAIKKYGLSPYHRLTFHLKGQQLTLF